MNLTPATVRLAIALLDHDGPAVRHYSWGLRVAARIRASVIFQTLDLFLEEGWLTDHWQTAEECAPAHEPRPYYLVTDAGRQGMAVFLSTARQDGRFEDLFPGAEGTHPAP